VAHQTAALKVRPYKDVMWTASSNPGNPKYYDCMELAVEDAEDKPWPINYRYVGKLSKTKSGKDCLDWHDTDLHFYFPLGDLAKNYCRNPTNLRLNTTLPVCFLDTNELPVEDYKDWEWEECSPPICGEDCVRNEEEAANAAPGTPPCQEFIEPSPDRQAIVSVISMGGVGIGDDVSNVDEEIVRKMVRPDGRIVSVDEPAKAAPLQILDMAFGGDHRVGSPNSANGEAWYSHVTQGGQYYGLLFLTAFQIGGEFTSSQMGLKFESGQDYLAFSYQQGLGNDAVDVVNENTTFDAIPPMGEDDVDILYFSPLWEVEGGEGRKIALLGDLGKYVPFSRQRIQDVQFNGNALSFSVIGSGDVSIGVLEEGENAREFVVKGQFDDDDIFDLDVFRLEFDAISLTSACRKPDGDPCLTEKPGNLPGLAPMLKPGFAIMLITLLTQTI